MRDSSLDAFLLSLSTLSDDHRERFLFYKPYTQQREFHAAGKTAKERLFMAANRFGKTYACCIEVCMHLTGLYPEWWDGYRYEEPVNVWAASVSREATRDILQKKYYLGDSAAGTKGLILPHQIVGKNYGSGGVPGFVDTVYVKHVSGKTSTLSFKSFDQGMEKFQGTERHIIHMDEEPPRDVYMECLMRTTATTPGFHGMILLSMVPLKGVTHMVQHFRNNRMIGMVTDGKFYTGGTWEQAPHLTLEEKAVLRSSMSPHELDARTKGIPIIGSGMVYPVPESKIICEPFPIHDHLALVYAIDFGWNPSPTAVLFAAYDRNNDILYFYDEYAETERTPAYHAEQIKRRGGDWMWGVYDPAGKISAINDGSKMVGLYYKQGLLRLTAANNSKEEGIITTLQRMYDGRLKIFPTNVRMIGELRMYARDENGIPIKGNDHFMDNMRYIVMSGLPFAFSRAEEYVRRHPAPPRDYGEHGWMRL
jgi:phage terminase large subunit-like protein